MLHVVCVVFTQLENNVRIPVTKSGSMSGLAYWFTLHFPNGETISTGPQAPEGVSESASVVHVPECVCAHVSSVPGLLFTSTVLLYGGGKINRLCSV